MIGLIATDVDGTMLRTDGTLSPRVKAALSAAVEAGIHVVPVTGRPIAIAGDIIRESGLQGHWIFANGAVTRHIGRDTLVRGFWIESELVVALVDKLRRSMPGVGFAIEFERAVVHEPGFDTLVPVVPDGYVASDVLSALRRASTGADGWGRVQKILVFDLSSRFEDLYRSVVDVAADDVVASYSGRAFVELAAGRVTKASALALLATDLGVARSSVVCFGDNNNDVPMLEWAGTGYAMANGTAEAKAAADEVIEPSDRDGLAVKVEELVAAHSAIG